MKIGIIGYGFVGKALRRGLKDNVKCIEIDPKLNTNINDLIKYKPDIVFICLPTPMNDDGTQNIDIVSSAVGEINKFDSDILIVLKSTILPKYVNDISKISSNIVINPEFLREGEAIRDFTYPDRIVVGSNDKKSNRTLKNLYNPLISKGAQYLNTSRRAAELIKYASNAFLATKITFINEIANLCEKTGINVEDISIGMGLDKRIGSRFLRAGPAYGGSCFPKDTKAIISTADQFKSNLSAVSYTHLTLPTILLV